MLAMSSVIVDYTFKKCVLTSFILQAVPSKTSRGPE